MRLVTLVFCVLIALRIVRLPAGVRPSELERHLAEAVTGATRSHPRIALEEIDEDEVVLRVSAAPASPEEGSRLADPGAGGPRRGDLRPHGRAGAVGPLTRAR